MSGETWVVEFENIVGVVEVRNTATHAVLSVWDADCEYKSSLKLAHRIAERLNRTEGDER